MYKWLVIHKVKFGGDQGEVPEKDQGIRPEFLPQLSPETPKRKGGINPPLKIVLF